MAIKLRPMHELVIVQPIKEEKKTAGGIVIPDAVNERKPLKATVVAIGQGRVLMNGDVRPLDVKVGDIVIYEPAAGYVVKYEEEEFTFIRESELIAIVRN